MGFMRLRKRGIEAQLRRDRPEAPAALVEDIASRVVPARQRSTTGSRLSFAASVAVLIVGSFASFGGIGYAASVTKETAHTVKQIAVHHHITAHRTSAASQYNTPPKNVGAAPTVQPKSHVLGVSTAPVQAQGTLPFTGISLGVTVAISLLLMGLGLMLRRRASGSA
jgi:hypothetical protein